PGDVARGEDPRPAGFEELIHGDAAIEGEASTLRDRDRRPDTHTYHQEIGIDRPTAAKCHGAPGDRCHRLAQVKHDTVRFVNRPYESSDFGAHDPLERDPIRRHDIHGEAARPERGRHLQADEAGADDDGTFRRPGALDNGAAVAERSEVEQRHAVGAWDLEPYWIGAGGDEQRAALASRAGVGAARGAMSGARTPRGEPLSSRTVRLSGSIEDARVRSSRSTWRWAYVS